MTRTRLAALLAVALAARGRPPPPRPIPDHPEKLNFPPLTFPPPVAKDYRVVLKNGMVVYIAEDRALPLVNIPLTVRAGSWLEPAGKEGLAGFTGSQMRRGGTKSLTAEQLDEKLDFLAAQVSSRHRRHLGRRLAQLPRRQPRRFAEALRRDAARAALPGGPARAREGTDPPGDEEAQRRVRRHRGARVGCLLYGETFFSNRFTTEASVKVDHPRRPGGVPPDVLLPRPT